MGYELHSLGAIQQYQNGYMSDVLRKTVRGSCNFISDKTYCCLGVGFVGGAECSSEGEHLASPVIFTTVSGRPEVERTNQAVLSGVRRLPKAPSRLR